jgi:uncharacterized protein YjiS (DUF1127 family)
MFSTQSHPYDESSLYHAAQRARAVYLRSAVRRLKHWLRNWLDARASALRTKRQDARQLQELMAMDDHMLRDIGISRSGAYFAFRYGRVLPHAANTNDRERRSPQAA